MCMAEFVLIQECPIRHLGPKSKRLVKHFENGSLRKMFYKMSVEMCKTDCPKYRKGKQIWDSTTGSSNLGLFYLSRVFSVCNVATPRDRRQFRVSTKSVYTGSTGTRSEFSAGLGSGRCQPEHGRERSSAGFILSCAQLVPNTNPCHQTPALCPIQPLIVECYLFSKIVPLVVNQEELKSKTWYLSINCLL